MSVNRLEQEIAYMGGEAERLGAQALHEAKIEAQQLGGEVLAVYTDIATNIAAGANHGTAAMAYHAALRDRDVLHQPGDDKALTEKAQGTVSQMGAHFKNAETGIEILKSVLLVGSLPKVDDSERPHATEEARLHLEGAGGSDLIARMTKLATGTDRRLAGVVSGPWGAARLRGDKDAHHAIQLQAMGAALQHGSPTEKAHAVAFTRLTTNLGKALAVHAQRARERSR